MKKVLMLGVIVSVLSGCAGLVPPRLEQKTTFNKEQAEKLMQSGKNTIKGSAFLRQNGGGVVTCAGLETELLPATEYAKERMTYLYGQEIETSVGFSNDPWKQPGKADAEYYKLRKVTVCNKDGEFVFENVADGEFYVYSSVQWSVGYSSQGGFLGKKVSVKNGETKTIMLSR